MRCIFSLFNRTCSVCIRTITIVPYKIHSASIGFYMLLCWHCTLLTLISYHKSGTFSLSKIDKTCFPFLLTIQMIVPETINHLLHIPLCTKIFLFSSPLLKSIKNSRNIPVSVDYTIDFHIRITYLVDKHIIFPDRIFVVCPKADSF